MPLVKLYIYSQLMKQSISSQILNEYEAEQFCNYNMKMATTSVNWRTENRGRTYLIPFLILKHSHALHHIPTFSKQRITYPKKGFLQVSCFNTKM